MREYDFELKFSLLGLCGYDCSKSVSSGLYKIIDSTDPTEKNLKLVEITLIAYDKFSPIYKNIYLELNINFGFLEVVWEPSTIRKLLLITSHNDIMKDRFTEEMGLKYGSKINYNKKSSTKEDNNNNKILIEEINSKTNEDIQDKYIVIEKEDELLKKENCIDNPMIWYNVKARSKKISFICVHPVQLFYFMSFGISETYLEFFLYNDHFEMAGSLGQSQILDLSNYPFTITNQDQYDQNQRKEILSSSQSQFFSFEYKAYYLHCPKLDGNNTSVAYVKFNPISFLYIHEYFFRVFNYFIYDFLGALGPNQEVLEYRNKKFNNYLSNKEDIEFMKLNIIFENPQLLLKPRPNSKEYFIINSGNLEISNSYEKVVGRVKSNLSEVRWLSKYLFKFKKLNIVTQDNFYIYEQNNCFFNLKMLVLTPADYLKNDIEIDKSYDMCLEIEKVNFNLRQIDYTNILKFNDLNFMFTDQLIEYYDYSHLFDGIDKTNIENENNIKNNDINYDIKEDSNQEINFKVLNDKSKSKKTKIDFNLFIYSHLYSFLFKVIMPEVSVKLVLHDTVFCELIYFNLEIEFKNMLSNNSEMNLSLDDFEFYHYLGHDNQNKIKKQLIIFNKQNKEVVLSINEDNFKSEKILSVKMTIYPDYEKTFVIYFTNITVLLRIDTFQILQSFFMEGFPFYNADVDIDIPHLYDPNEDNYPGIKVVLDIKNSIICMLSDNLSNINQNLICFSSNFYYEYVKKKILSVKKELKHNFNQINELLNNKKLDDTDQVELNKVMANDKGFIYRMYVNLTDVSPFICCLKDLMQSNYLKIAKKVDNIY